MIIIIYNSVVLEKQRMVNVYVDGACSDNGKPNAKAGYGVYFGENDPRNENGVVVGKQSNNTGELTAFIRALEILKDNIEQNEIINIYIDSEYVIKCASSYGEKLENNNWKTSNDKVPPNLELIKKARSLFKNKVNIKLHYIRAHTNKDDIHSKGNSQADRLACLAIGVDPDAQIIKIQEEITILEWITFKNKDEAKKYGAKWDIKNKYWYINNDISEENKNKIFELQNKKESTISKVNENDKKYVKINYNNKNKAKNLGAKWDATIKSWYYIESSISEDNKKELIALQII